MKKSLFVFSLAFIACSIVFLIGSSSKDAETLQAESIYKDHVPHELLIKLKEDMVGDIIQNQWIFRNVVNLVQGKMKTYLHEEKDTFDWDPALFKHRSFHADPYLLHIKVPVEIDLDYAISLLKLNPFVEYVEKNGLFHILKINGDYLTLNTAIAISTLWMLGTYLQETRRL